jgi:hypothetical protein
LKPVVRGPSVVLGLSFLWLALGVARAWHFWATGMVISDEYGYIWSAWRGELENALLGHRQAFALANIILFRALGLTNVDRVAVALPFYVSLWAGITFFSVWLIARELGYEERTSSLVLLAMAASPAFIFPSLGLFTEGMALAYAALGLYLLIRTVKRGGVWSAPLSAAFFGLASRTREPYSLLFLVSFLLPLIYGVLGRRRLILAAALMFIVLLGAFVMSDPPLNQVVNSVRRVNDMLNPGTVQPFPSQQPETPSGQTGGSSSGNPGQTGGTGPPGGQRSQGSEGAVKRPETSGLLTLVGIKEVPQGPVARALTLMALSLTVGYGPVLVVLLAGFGYMLLRLLLAREVTKWLGNLLLSLLFLGTLGGVLLVFMDYPEYFGVRHYSTLLRFTNPTLLMLPLTAAPFVSTLASSQRRMRVAVLTMASLYLLVSPYMVQAATTNLQPWENPLNPSPPPERVALLWIRGDILAHPDRSPAAILGISEGFLIWLPGLSGRPDVSTHPYLTPTELGQLEAKAIYVFLPKGLEPLRERYPELYKVLILAAVKGYVDGFTAHSVTLDSDNNMLVVLTRN